PPREPATSQTVKTGPPAASTVLSFPREKNPMKRSSGDQNGFDPPSVPANSSALSPAKGRTHTISCPPELVATNARLRPLWETVTGQAKVGQGSVLRCQNMGPRGLRGLRRSAEVQASQRRK